MPPLRIGTAGWSIPKAQAAAFPQDGSALVRYAARLDAVEINSSFYRPHRPATYARWAESVPDGFRFAAKMPKAITHDARLVDVEGPLARFLGEVGALGPKLGPLLVQLPPSLVFDPAVADAFFRRLGTHTGRLACEPRHPSWFTPEAERLLARHEVARVAADPAPVPEAARPGGWPGLVYLRLHGAPRMYWSNYEPAALAAIAQSLAGRTAETWCIFDNTAAGAALANAIEMRAMTGDAPRPADRPP